MNKSQHILEKRKGNVLSFGEVLLRICPDTEGQWLQENNVPCYVGGAEANVAAALALWNIPSSYVSAIPDNMIGKQVAEYLSQKKINITRMLFSGERLGLYFLPKGKDLKNAGVTYDRNYSSFSQLKSGMIDWDRIFEDIAWLNFTAICPAINSSVATVCKEAVMAASKKNIIVSIDLNYRAKLWQYGKQPQQVMPELLQYCDVVMGNIWAVEKMLGISINKNITTNSSKDDYVEQALETSKSMISQFPKIKLVANTFRFDQEKNGINYYATLFADDNMHLSSEYYIEKVIDKVGSGDCFMAGLIYGLYNNLSRQQTLEFATSAAVKKLNIQGDFTNTREEEIIASLGFI